MKIEFKDYQIGFLTQLFDVSADTIRLYAKKDLLEPKKSEANKYRIFCREDVFNMDCIMRLRDMGFPLEDIREIVCNSTLDEVYEKVEERRAALEEELRRLTCARDNLKNHSRMLKSMLEDAEQTAVTSEAVTFLMIDIQDSIPETKAFLQKLDPELRPYLTLHIPDDGEQLECNQDFLDKKKRGQADFVITCEDVNGISRRPDFPHDRIRLIGSARFVYSIGTAYLNSNYEFVEKVSQFIDEHHLTRNGNYFTQYLMSQYIHGNPIDYYRTFVPITD